MLKFHSLPTELINSLCILEKMIEDGLLTPVYAPELAPLNGKIPKIISLQLSSKECCNGRNGTYATSFFHQWYLLFLRTMLCLRRDRSLALMRFFIHFTIAILVGTLYFNIGNDAAMMYNNFRYIAISQMFLLFTSFSTMNIICKCIKFLFSNSNDREC